MATTSRPTPLVDFDAGLVSARAFADPAIYHREIDQIYGRSWLFVAHESELPRPGSFVTRWMGEDPVIVCRGADGQVRVFLNACRHRGRKVCSDDLGQTAQFRCPYHGWTYNAQGELVGVPFLAAYQNQLDLPTLGLLQAPRVASRHGLVFATWATEAPDLGTYLGPLGWVFDLLFGRTAAMEVVGPPQRWVVGANWKLGAANFAGDAYHVANTHGYIDALGMKNPRGTKRAGGYIVAAPHGHLASLVNWHEGTTCGEYLGLPPELWPEIESRLGRDQLAVMKPLRVIAGNAFPNLSFLETASTEMEEWAGEDFPAMSFLTIRQWQPRGPDRMEIWSWQLMDRNTPERWRQASQACYQREFGMAGVFEQDDVENWAGISDGLRGPAARRLALQYRMGLNAPPPTTWPGPGLAYVDPPLGELNERLFYRHWEELIADGDPSGGRG
jgi:phenylpropionate dioxygenase-like ring-hydroxylating dioxygenase large terminal subunit